MATLPVVNAFDRRAGVISALAAMVILLVVILLMKYEMADPPPQDIPMTLAEPLDVTEVKNVVADIGSSGGGTPAEAPQSDPKQSEAVLTNDHSDHVVNVGNGNVNNAPSDNPPSGNESDNPFGDGGTGGGEGGGNGPGFGNDNGPGNNDGTGVGNGGVRKVIRDVSFDMNYDYTATVAFKVTIDDNGNVIAATLIKGGTTTTDQILINKVRAAVIKQVKYSVSKGAPAITKQYIVKLDPR